MIINCASSVTRLQRTGGISVQSFKTFIIIIFIPMHLIFFFPDCSGHTASLLLWLLGQRCGSISLLHPQRHKPTLLRYSLALACRRLSLWLWLF